MFQNSLLYSNHELKRLRRLHFRIESSNQVASRRRCHYPTLYQGSNTSTIFDRPYSLLRNQRCRREDGKKKLIRTTSRTVNLLLAPSFFSLSLSRDLSAWSSLCVFTEIGEAAGSYFPADSVGRLQRLQILLRFSEPLSPAKPFAQFPLLLISFRRGEQQ